MGVLYCVAIWVGTDVWVGEPFWTRFVGVFPFQPPRFNLQHQFGVTTHQISGFAPPQVKPDM